MIRKGTPTSLNYNNLPPPILSLFAPRKPVDYLPPIEKDKLEPYSCISDYLDKFEEPGEIVEHPLIEVRVIKEDRLVREKAEKHLKTLEENLKKWNPKEDEKIQGDPEKTVFVGRLSYEMTEEELKKEFETYGTITNIRMVKDLKGKPRGYAFITFSEIFEAKKALRHDDKMLDGFRIVVELEKGRVEDGWKPKRLGGGKGEFRKPLPKYKHVKILLPTRGPGVRGGRGGGRGGSRGGGGRRDDRGGFRGRRDDDRGPRRDDRGGGGFRGGRRDDDRGPPRRDYNDDKRDRGFDKRDSRDFDRNRSYKPNYDKSGGNEHDDRRFNRDERRSFGGDRDKRDTFDRRDRDDRSRGYGGDRDDFKRKRYDDDRDYKRYDERDEKRQKRGE